MSQLGAIVLPVESRYTPPLPLTSTYSPSPRPPGLSKPLPGVAPAPTIPAVVFAVQAEQREIYTGGQFARFFAHTTNDAAAAIANKRPRLVVLDWDEPSIDSASLCRIAMSIAPIGILAVTGKIESVPAALRSGAHAILLKPFAPNLVAARLGRTLRETAPGGQHVPARVWPATLCPQCSAGGSIGFDFHSHRRTWYACLSCDHTWLGPRQE